MIEATPLCTVAVAIALVRKMRANVAAKPAAVRKALKARIDWTHGFYAAHCTQRNGKRDAAFRSLDLCCG